MALLPPVQLALVRAATSDLENVAFDLGSVRASPWGLELRDLSLAGPGYSLSIADVDVDFAVWSSIRHWRAEIEAASLRGVDLRLQQASEPVDASREGTESGPRAVPAWPRLGETAIPPRWVAVRAADAEGTVTVAAGSDAILRSDWRIVAAGWAPVSTGTATLNANIDAIRDGEPLASLTMQTVARADITPESTLDEFTIESSLATIDDERGLDISASGNPAQAPERYAMAIDSRAGERLLAIEAEIADGERLAAQWVIDLPSGVVAAFARGRSLADLTATSSGRLGITRGAGLATIEANAAVLGSGWDAFDPRLQQLGPLTLTVDLDAEVAPGRISARTARIALAAQERGELMHVEALQPLSLATDSWLIDPERLGEPAIRAVLDEMPLRWLQRFDPSGTVVDGEASLSIDVIRDGERETRLIASEPITASRVELTPVGGTEVPLFDVRLVPEATLSDGVLNARIEELSIEAETGLAVAFTGSGSTSPADWPRVAFSGELSAQVPALQRIITPLHQLRASTQLAFDFKTLVLSISGASASALGREGRQLLAADLSGQTPLEIKLPTFRPDWQRFEPQSVTLIIDRLPIDWLNSYLPELGFVGGELSGRLQAQSTVGRGLRLTTDTPMAIDNLRPSFRGRPFAPSLHASVRPLLVLDNESSLLALEDLSVTTDDGDSLRGRLALQADADADSIAFNVSLDGNFPTIASRSGARLGTMRYRQRGTMEPGEQRLDLDELELELSTVNDSKFLRIESLQPFFIRAEPFSVGTDGETPDILRASVTPLRLEQLLPQIFGFDLEGVLPEGEFFARAGSDGGIVLAADEPLLFRDVTMRWDDAKLLDRVTMSVGYEIKYSIDGIEASSLEISASGPDRETMFDLSSRILAPLNTDQTWTFASLAINASLPALANQPVLDDLPHFLSGDLVSNIILTNGAQSTVEFSAAMRNAETERLGALPDIDVGLDLAGVPGQSVRLTMPITLHSSGFGDSDLRLDGTIEHDESGHKSIDAALTGARLAASDLSKLLALVAPSDDDVSGRDGIDRSAIARLRTERHEKPVWTDQLAGTASVDVGRVLFPSFEVDDLAGRFALSASRAELVDLHASLLDAELAADASIDFDTASPTPYSLDFSAAVDGLELGRLFQSVDPAAVPTAEGRFDFAAELNGTGRNPLDLALSTYGQISLTGNDGVFRGLASVAGTGSTASRVIGILTFSRELRAVARILDGLGEIRFEEADVELTRTVSNRIVLDRLLLRAPQVSLQASGDIQLSPQQPLLLSPLDLTAEIAARGDVATLFDGMDLLQGDRDDTDYRPMTRPISITGTAAEPDMSSFWELLDEGAENARGGFGLGLRALDRRLQASRENQDL